MSDSVVVLVDVVSSRWEFDEEEGSVVGDHDGKRGWSDLSLEIASA